MNNTSASGILWTGRDPRDQPVQIKDATWFQKIGTTPDRVWLLRYVDCVKQVFVDPRIILEDVVHPNREHYVDLFFPPEKGHIMGMVVIAEVLDNGMRDLVTIIAKSNTLRQEKGGILYERSSPTT